MGRAAALRILDESGKVVLTDCSPTVLKNLEQEFDAMGYSDRILFLQSDVRQYTDCCAVVRHGIEVFKKIDVLVTTAGILRHHPIDELTEGSKTVMWSKPLKTFSVQIAGCNPPA